MCCFSIPSQVNLFSYRLHQHRQWLSKVWNNTSKDDGAKCDNLCELHFECSFQGYPTCLLFPFHLSPGHLKCRNCGQNAKFENCIFKDNPSAHLTKYTQLVLSCLKLLCECQLRRISWFLIKTDFKQNSSSHQRKHGTLSWLCFETHLAPIFGETNVDSILRHK